MKKQQTDVSMWQYRERGVLKAIKFIQQGEQPPEGYTLVKKWRENDVSHELRMNTEPLFAESQNARMREGMMAFQNHLATRGIDLFNMPRPRS